MSHNLRNVKRLNYAVLNDIDPDVLKVLNTKAKTLKWSKNAAFSTEIVKKLDHGRVKIHFVGYSNEYDKIVERSELIRTVSPPAVNGPIALDSLFSAARILILGELNGSSHCLPTREVRIEIPEDLIAPLAKALNTASFPQSIEITVFRSILGDDFDERYFNIDGDRCLITSNIYCRVYFPPPEKCFKLYNGLVIEHHFLKNPIFIMQFSMERRAAALDKSVEL